MFGNTFGPTAFDLKFRLFGVDTRVHPSFWLGGLMFAQNAGPMPLMLASIATLFVSILVHEMGHALSGKYFRDRSPSIVLHMMGGYYSPGNALKHGQLIWMVVWGPLAGFILGSVAIGSWFALGAGLLPDSEMLRTILWDAMWINIIWGVVNVLPVFPLDGGQIFREVVRWKFPLKDDAFSYSVSMVTAILVAGLMLAAHLTYHILGLFPAIFSERSRFKITNCACRPSLCANTDDTKPKNHANRGNRTPIGGRSNGEC